MSETLTDARPGLDLTGIPNGVIGRLDDHSGYVDPATDQEYPSVTSVLSAAISKPWLAPWGAKSAAAWTLDNLDLLVANRDAGVDRAALLKLITVSAQQQREIKAEMGRHWHDVLESLILDAPYPALPEHLQGVSVDGEPVDFDHVSGGLLNFLSDFRLEPLMAECTVADPDDKVAGTLDLLARFRGLRLPMPHGGVLVDPIGLIDCKTGAHLDPHFRAQLARYRRMKVAWLPFGRTARMPWADFTAVLHLRAEHTRGYKLVRADMAADGTDLDGPAFAWFRHCHRQLVDQREQSAIRGYPLYPPQDDGSQPMPLLEDITHPGLARAVKPLSRAGIATLHDLALFTAAELVGGTRKGDDKGVKGVGATLAVVLRDVLARWGMAFRDETAPAVEHLPLAGPPAGLVAEQTQMEVA